MDLFLILAIIFFTVLILIILLFILIYNKYQFAVIKIEEAENNIDILLEKKLDFMMRLIPLYKEVIKKDTKDLDRISNFKDRNLNGFELDKELSKAKITFLEYYDNNKKLAKKDSINIINREIDDNDDDLAAAKKFYNDNITIYNKLVRCFPSNIIGLFLKYKQKEFYSDEKIEVFEILKD